MHVSKHRIFIVDDDPGLLRLLRLRLLAAGFDVLTFESGDEAMAHLSSQPPHLVITDLCMPGMDGLDFCKVIHQQHPHLPVILLTAHTSSASATAARQSGIFSIVPKPFESTHLLAQVAVALETSRPSCPYEALESYSQPGQALQLSLAP